MFALLTLAGCGSPPPNRARSRDTERPRIAAGDTLNCNKMIHYVRPVYPRQARNKHVEGTVTLRGVITKAGDLRDVSVLRGDPIFVPEALRVARQWRYTPCLINSEPVEIVTTFDIDFNLSQ